MMAAILQPMLAAAMAAAQPQDLPDRRPIGEIEFFGDKGIDVERVRAALPFHEGDLFPPSTAAADDPGAAIVERVRSAIGRPPTDVTFTCCDDRMNWMIYIGLPGGTSQTVAFNPPPTGDARLPLDLVMLSDEIDQAVMTAVMHGNGGEDDSRGFSLSVDPALRTNEMDLRAFTLRHEREVLTVLETSADVAHRAVAAQALGYARQSDRQVAALARACFDAGENVRNRAVRALAVLLGAKTSLAAHVPADGFVRLLTSGQWTDHNKAVMLLDVLTRARDARVLAAVHAGALENLIEMARWRSIGHAAGARLLLGRIAWMDEKRLQELVQQGRGDEIISAVSAH
jgi:hypothetical protein